jgi:hypothetical protein
VDDAALPVEAKAALDADAERGIGRKPDPAHHGEQLITRADAGAAIAEVARGSLEHCHVPAGSTQQMGREQPANRAADHQCAWPRQVSAPSFAMMMMTILPDADERALRMQARPIRNRVARDFIRAVLRW